MSLELVFDGTKYTGSLQGRSTYGGEVHHYNISLLEDHQYSFGISYRDNDNYSQYYYRLYSGSTIEAYGTPDANWGNPTGGFTYRSENDQNYSLRILGRGYYTVTVNSIDIPDFDDGDASFSIFGIGLLIIIPIAPSVLCSHIYIIPLSNTLSEKLGIVTRK